MEISSAAASGRALRRVRVLSKGDCMLVGRFLFGWFVLRKGVVTYLVLRDSLLQRQLVLIRLLLRGREELKERPSFSLELTLIVVVEVDGVAVVVVES